MNDTECMKAFMDASDALTHAEQTLSAIEQGFEPQDDDERQAVLGVHQAVETLQRVRGELYRTSSGGPSLRSLILARPPTG